ncbi:MAG: HEAT repeat domain-containing protein [Alphaproteobacteria bacterium]|nr:HEAT repeat domain-containing protein [Alphaproteobacteria bacterium]
MPRVALLTALILLACGRGEPLQAPPDDPAKPGSAAAQDYAARGAPSSVAEWEGAWTLTGVFATRMEDPAAQALARALGVKLRPWEGRRPAARPGQIAVVHLGSSLSTEAWTRRLEQDPGGPGEGGGAVVVVLGSGEEAWRRQALAELPWLDVGVVDPTKSVTLYAAASRAQDPVVAGGVAAVAVAEHFGLARHDLAPGPKTPPGLAQLLGPVDASALSAADPRARTEAAWRLPAEALTVVAGDPQVAVRLAVAARTADPALASDPEPLVRARVADNTDDVEILARMVGDGSSVVRVVATHRLAILAASGRREPGLLAALTEAAASPDAYQRWKAAYGLTYLPGGRDTLLGLLREDVDIDVRREAARALGHHRGPEVRDALVAALSDENSFVRRWAARGLGEIGDPAAIEPLKRAATEPTALVASEAARALERLGVPTRPVEFKPRARPRTDAELEAQLASPDATVRKDVAKFLAGRPDAQPHLARLARDGDSEVRKSAVAAMAYDPEQARALPGFLSDPDPDTRVAALNGIVENPVVPAPGLAALLEAADTEERLRAAEAMAALIRAGHASPADAAALAARLGDPDERVRAAAAAVFPERASADDPSVLVRRAAHLARADALVASARPGADPDAAAWAQGVLAREDELVHLRFSWNRPEDRPGSHRALRPPVIREYGHPDRG